MNENSKNLAKDYYENYNEYNRILRTWFVGFGIGGPVALLVNENLAKALAESGKVNLIAGLFLIGGGVQILIAFINKIHNWSNYYGEENPEYKNTKKYKFCDCLSNLFWIDIVCDIVSFVFFVAGIILIVLFVFPKII